MYEEDEYDDDSSESDTPVESKERCVRVRLPRHVRAYLNKEEVIKDVEPLECDKNLLENITTNYVIAKKIICHLRWQDKMLCKHVCSMWNSVVTTLQKEEQIPVDFGVSMLIGRMRNGIKYLKSSTVYTEPMVVFTFTNSTGFTATAKCQGLVPSPCEPACEKEHYIIDMIYQDIAGPKNCMHTVKACILSYMPLANSISYENAIKHKMETEADPLFVGVSIPVIPDVEYNVINVKSLKAIQEQFYDEIDRISENRIIKGALVFANDNFLLHSVEDIIFLNYFKNVQNRTPYALGGCVVEDSISKRQDINEIIQGINRGNRQYVSVNLISIGLFSIPKLMNRQSEQQSPSFDMYSVILESIEWSKAKIQATITEFAKKVRHFEHSVALKLSCVGRDNKHETEQQYFQAAFPNTRIVGCYGNGELGVNHPARPDAEETAKFAKRHRGDPGPQYGVMYSYSTVFVYIGWGKVVKEPEIVAPESPVGARKSHHHR